MTVGYEAQINDEGPSIEHDERNEETGIESVGNTGTETIDCYREPTCRSCEDPKEKNEIVIICWANSAGGPLIKEQP